MTFQRGLGGLTLEEKTAYAERRAVIAAHYQASRSLAVTARAFGISRQRVWAIVHGEQQRRSA